ncbi:hypothetical protein IFM89_021282, partial [Coptis chinensis]
VIDKERGAGIVHLMDESEVTGHKGSSPHTKVLIYYACNFIRKNLRQSINNIFEISHEWQLKVGMAYELLFDVVDENEINVIDKERGACIVHLMDESEVTGHKGSTPHTKVLINYAYNFIRKNLRQSINNIFEISHEWQLKVGMAYELLFDVVDENEINV